MEKCYGGLICFVLFAHDILELEACQDVWNQPLNIQPVPTVNQTYRTGFHFHPSSNWMNDPNGPMIYKGIYHLFYQYNPNGPFWETAISWGHSTSTDLVNWTPHDLIMKPSEPYDINGCWSGSVTILPGDRPAILYTGIDQQNGQVQNLALPKDLSDPFLREWEKSPYNPLMTPTPLNNINASLFRDPSTAWLGPDGLWRVVVGNKMNNIGTALLYRSKDFVNWTKAEHPLHYSNSSTEMWECPDFFPVSTASQDGIDTSVNGEGIKHVLKTSLFELSHEYYTIGTYDSVKDIFTPDEGSVDDQSGLRVDYGKFYASKTFFDSTKNRRILWGWVNESTNAAIDIKKGWSGLQAIPRKIWLDKSTKQLVQWPIKEIEKLREHKVRSASRMLQGGSVIDYHDFRGAQADIDLSIAVRDFEKADILDPTWTNPKEICSRLGTSKGGIGPYGLFVLSSLLHEEYTAVFFRVFKGQDKYVVLMCSDQRRSSLHLDYDKPTYGAFVDVDPAHEELSLRILIDNSIVESFGGGGKTCITARVYPTLAIGDQARLFILNNGSTTVNMTRLNIWPMKNAQVNIHTGMIDC